MSSKPVLLLTGSERKNANTPGISSFILSRWQAKVSSSSVQLPSLIYAKDAMPSGMQLPIGPILEEKMTQSIHSPEEYQSKETQEWSKVAKNSSAIVIVTPQYNWGIPGHLKNLLDHLYNEWKDKPFLIFTFGGHGGSKCAEQLIMVVKGGLKANLIGEPVQITLPMDYIRTNKRVQPGDEDEFLQSYKEKIDEAIDHLAKQLLQE